MSTNRSIRIGLVGHRDITDPHIATNIRQEARGYFSQWKAMYSDVEIVTQLAVGADTILTKSALEYSAKLTVVVPFTEYEADFSANELQEYRALSKMAKRTERLPFQERSDIAYDEAGHWIVEYVDVILAVWDGKPAHGDGGTASIITYAKEMGKTINIIQASRTIPQNIPSPKALPATLPKAHATDGTFITIRYNEYAVVFDNTAKLSDRRQTVNDLFVGINSLILTALGLLFVSSHLKTWWTASAFGVVTLFTFGANWIWLSLIQRYKTLINLRISYLESLERLIAEMGAFKMMPVYVSFAKEKQVVNVAFGIHTLESQTLLYANAPKVGFSRLERNLIIYFMIMYVLFTVLVAVLTYFVMKGALPPLNL